MSAAKAVPFCLLLTLFAVNARADVTAPVELQFNRDIRPILSDKCFACHGLDEKKRKGDRRLDTADGATKEQKGIRAIVPGDPGRSDVWARINSNDPDERMPPPQSHKTLSAAQKQTIRRWIEQGRKYQQHWSFEPISRPPVPLHGVVLDVFRSGPAKTQAPRPAPRAAWARNPIDHFILDRLKAEHLDPSPPADRATLIRRLSFDLTGLPPTPAEIDAFLADSADGAYERLVDRLLASPHFGERMALDWLDAARFADTHGYQRDAGRDMSLWREWVIEAFNRNMPFDRFAIEQLAGDLLPVPSGAEGAKRAIDQKIASGFNRNHMVNVETGAVPEEFRAIYVTDRVNTTGTVFLGLTVGCAQCHDHKFDPLTQREYYQLFAFFNNVAEKGIDGARGNAAPLLELPTPDQQHKLGELKAKQKQIESQFAGSIPAADAAQALWEKAPYPVEGQVPQAIAKLLAIEPAQRTELPSGDLRRFYRREVWPEGRQLTRRLAEVKKQIDDAQKQVRSAMVMQENLIRRETFVLARGQYDKPGEKVEPAVPAFLPPMPADAPRNRLGLAMWLTDRANPLTARVEVNRLWQIFFGTGIVRTAEDFGSQGEPPTQPELVDWLAAEFMDRGWDIKHIVRLIVTSAAYRQSSVTTPDALAKDPECRLLSRYPRRRLQAEFIRDQALSVSGLLDPRIGGASVWPYQPAGLWEELMSRTDGARLTAQKYVQSHGPDLYRRTMYTFWKRTCPPPAMSAFDAPDRETCTVRRAVTNTPLQALVLMNDPTYVEAARKLAERMMKEAGPTAESRIPFASRLLLAREPSAQETSVLKRLYDEQFARFQKDTNAAGALLAVGESPRDKHLDVAEHAAWTAVASVMLNLDEAVTKR